MKTQIKSLQQFNEHLGFISEKHEAFMLDLPECSEIQYQFTDLELPVFKEIAGLYNTFAPMPLSGKLSLLISRCKGTMVIHVYSVNVKACINYEEA